MSDISEQADRVEPPEADDESNLGVWKRLERTDPKFTKKMTTGAKLTTINAEYQFRKMTEVFGMAGEGWGYEILASDLVDFGEMKTVDQQGNEHSFGSHLIHTCRVRLWYLHPDTSEKCYVQATGHTPARFIATHNGKQYVRVDDEYEKKSITDALTKAMSFIGMAADVRMGMFDMPDYVAGRLDEEAIRGAEDAESERVRQRHEFEDWFERTIEIMETAASIRELEIIFKGAKPRVERQGNQEAQKKFTSAKNARARTLLGKDGKKPENSKADAGKSNDQKAEGGEGPDQAPGDHDQSKKGGRNK